MRLKYACFVLILLPLLGAQYGLAQQKDFIKAGKIVYEKRINALRLLKNSWDDEDGEPDTWRTQILDLFQKNYKPFQVMNFDLLFTDAQSLFYKSKNAHPEEQTLPNYINLPAQENTVYTNFNTAQSISQKYAANTDYLITDSVRKINWKITNETRDIAGFRCRRANALILDSVYLVAFYCPQIIAPVGPEGITGLPGAILGLAIPYEHVTWFATSVVTNAESAKIVPPVKGKKIAGKDYSVNMKTVYGNWGKQGKTLYRYAMF